ncbi:unnamed protein product [Rhizoctonia solani]|uniref:Uncharacterized protein n=1 Tax=Rhizoctonia solani TaxID=456999 RepID=A0A8H3HUM1_9AGAM|nr:unnamed protein product [Rhizoctonia solani]
MLNLECLYDFEQTVQGSDIIETSGDDRPPSGTDTNYGFTPSILGAGLCYTVNRPIHMASNDFAALEDFNHAWLQSQTQLTPYRRSLAHELPSAENSLEATFGTQSSGNYTAGFVGSLCASIPPSIISAQTIKDAHFIHTINE